MEHQLHKAGPLAIISHTCGIIVAVFVAGVRLDQSHWENNSTFRHLAVTVAYRDPLPPVTQYHLRGTLPAVELGEFTSLVARVARARSRATYAV